MELDRKLIESALIEADINLKDVRWDYSGKWMFGKRCFGFTVDSNAMTAFGRFLIQLMLLADSRDEAEDIAGALADRVATDDMGKGTIVYFPGLQIAEDDSE